MDAISKSKKPRNWTRRRINAELRALGLRQAQLIPQTGRSQAMVSLVVSGKMKSLPVAAVIAAALGRQPHEIWPRLYAPPAPPSGAPTTEPTAEPGPTALAS